MKVSVIVAVYAAEKYLSRCLDGLLKQTLEDFEILLIDDGSKDHSGIICDNYSKQDSRIKCFHKENGGVSSARQKGLDEACGEFIIHVDPDDWVEPTMLEEMYNFAVTNNADIVICDFYTEYAKKTKYESQKPSNLDNKSVLLDLLKRIHGSCWNKLVRKSLFEKYDIKFPNNMIVWEDLYVNCMLCLNPVNISYLPKAYYHYNQKDNINSLMKSISRSKFESMLFFINYFSKIELLNSLENALVEKKTIIKRNAFLYLSPTKKEFVKLYPEIDDYLFQSSNQVDKLIRLALCHSWCLSRIILLLGKMYSWLKKK